MPRGDQRVIPAVRVEHEHAVASHRAQDVSSLEIVEMLSSGNLSNPARSRQSGAAHDLVPRVVDSLPFPAESREPMAVSRFQFFNRKQETGSPPFVLILVAN